MKAEIMLAMMVMACIGLATGIAATLGGPIIGYMAFAISTGAVLVAGGVE